ncbi:hypothetical protein ACPPVW_06185 [Leifsonia sp. McL0607]|uniref:hypothetical protein n=1 Tax=Leifsonia sp. McL0607 TaxID=3415672 RepID=UPI003CEA7335
MEIEDGEHPADDTPKLLHRIRAEVVLQTVEALLRRADQVAELAASPHRGGDVLVEEDRGVLSDGDGRGEADAHPEERPWSGLQPRRLLEERGAQRGGASVALVDGVDVEQCRVEPLEEVRGTPDQQRGVEGTPPAELVVDHGGDVGARDIGAAELVVLALCRQLLCFREGGVRAAMDADDGGGPLRTCRRHGAIPFGSECEHVQPLAPRIRGSHGHVETRL